MGHIEYNNKQYGNARPIIPELPESNLVIGSHTYSPPPTTADLEKFNSLPLSTFLAFPLPLYKNLYLSLSNTIQFLS
jgi:hypothetical protein